MKRLLLLLLVFFATCQPVLLSAHVLDPGYLNLDAMGEEHALVGGLRAGPPLPLTAPIIAHKQPCRYP